MAIGLMSAELFLAAIELPAVGAPGRWRGAPLRDGRGNYRGPGRAAPGPTARRSQKTPRNSRHPPPRGWPQQAGTGEGGGEGEPCSCSTAARPAYTPGARERGRTGTAVPADPLRQGGVDTDLPPFTSTSHTGPAGCCPHAESRGGAEAAKTALLESHLRVQVSRLSFPASALHWRRARANGCNPGEPQSYKNQGTLMRARWSR